jgi:hypothetical protein
VAYSLADRALSLDDYGCRILNNLAGGPVNRPLVARNSTSRCRVNFFVASIAPWVRRDTSCPADIEARAMAIIGNTWPCAGTAENRIRILFLLLCPRQRARPLHRGGLSVDRAHPCHVGAKGLSTMSMASNCSTARRETHRVLHQCVGVPAGNPKAVASICSSNSAHPHTS